MKNYILLLTFFIVSCNNNSSWVNLISENSLKGWHIFQNDGTKNGWSVEDNVLIFDAELSEKNMLISDASLVSDKKYLNFEIKFDWKIERGGNSGFMWSVDEDLKYKFPYQTGPEIQIIDTETYLSPESIKGGEIEINNILNDIGKNKNFLGAVYGISPPSKLNISNPAGEWNSYYIKIDHRNNKGKVKQVLKKISSSIPVKHIANPTEFVQLILFLCTKEASYVNGTAISVDGGSSKTLF